MSTAASLEVAETIRAQLGHHAAMMLGASGFVGDKNSLQFKIGRNVKKVTHIVITLVSSDTYTVEFLKVGRLDWKVLSRAEGVDVSSLHRVIEAHTEMRTSL